MEKKTIRIFSEDLDKLNSLKEETHLPIIHILHTIVSMSDKDSILKNIMEVR